MDVLNGLECDRTMVVTLHVYEIMIRNRDDKKKNAGLFGISSPFIKCPSCVNYVMTFAVTVGICLALPLFVRHC